MDRVNVCALKSFTHEGQDVSRGDAMSVTPIDAATLSFAGKVSLLEAGTYRTQGIPSHQAEPPQTAPTATSANQESTTKRSRSRRTYRRRDMVAQS